MDGYMNRTWSILHATYQRPEKALAAMQRWFERASRENEIEYIFAVNSDDESKRGLMASKLPLGMKIITGPFAGSAPAWNAAAQASTGLILIQAQDDVEPPENWDDGVWDAFDRGGATAILQFADNSRKAYSVEPTFIAVSDGYRKDRLCCTAIMNRARYEQAGEFLHPGYTSVFSDDDVTIRAYADAANGKCTLIEARDLVFLHRHHYHDKSVPFDATYARENSSEAYAQGQALFMKRNAELVRRGFKTW